jgi:hypothetical protein
MLMYYKGADSDHDRTIDIEPLNIQRYDLDALDIIFIKEEVWNINNTLPSNKALGHVGFIGRFYKNLLAGGLRIQWMLCTPFGASISRTFCCWT